MQKADTYMDKELHKVFKYLIYLLSLEVTIPH